MGWATGGILGRAPGHDKLSLGGEFTISPDGKYLVCKTGTVLRLSEERDEDMRLHALDVKTTLSDNADELVKLWDKDAVRLQAGHPAEVGKAVIYADDKKWEQSKDRDQMLTYMSDIKDVQIVGDWAFEWGYASGSYRDAAGKIVDIRGKQLRVMKRQPDGEWKFARVMGIIDSRK